MSPQRRDPAVCFLPGVWSRLNAPVCPFWAICPLQACIYPTVLFVGHIFSPTQYVNVRPVLNVFFEIPHTLSSIQRVSIPRHDKYLPGLIGYPRKA